MKILSTAYTDAHGFRALKRLHRAAIYNQILPNDLHKLYQALIHLERYIEHLAHRQSSLEKQAKAKDPFKQQPELG